MSLSDSLAQDFWKTWCLCLMRVYCLLTFCSWLIDWAAKQSVPFALYSGCARMDQQHSPISSGSAAAAVEKTNVDLLTMR